MLVVINWKVASSWEAMKELKAEVLGHNFIPKATWPLKGEGIGRGRKGREVNAVALPWRAAWGRRLAGEVGASEPRSLENRHLQRVLDAGWRDEGLGHPGDTQSPGPTS